MFNLNLEAKAPQIRANWEKGDVFTFNIVSTTKKTSPQADTTITNSGKSTMRWEVVDKTKDTYKIHVSYSDYEGDSDNPAASLFAEFATTMSIDFLTDKYGTYLGLDDISKTIESFKEFVPSLVQGVFDKRGVSSDEQESAKKIFEMTVQQMLSPAFVSKIFEEDITPLLMVHGSKLCLGKTYYQNYQVQTITGASLDGTRRIALMGKDDLAYIYTQAQPNEEALKAFSLEYVNSLVKALSINGNFPEGTDLVELVSKSITDFSISEEFLTTIRISVGIPVAHTYIQKQVVSGPAGDSTIEKRKDIILQF